MSDEPIISAITPAHFVRNHIDNLLQFSPITITEEYRKKWNIHLTDFVCLTSNGELVRPTLYRIGGIGTPKLNVDRYFMLLKHVEAFYTDDITKVMKDKPHLESRWCILDIHGNEKVELESFSSPYLIDDSCVYSIDRKYYNIETGEPYCTSYDKMESTESIFLNNSYDDDKSKRGVMKISKADGSWEFFT